jgi:hypothetical protein
MEKPKTLIGKDNYLFLINDSARELEVHNDNVCLVSNNFHERYKNNINKLLLIVIPNKSLVYKHLLPEPYDLRFRPGFKKYKNIFQHRILDGYSFLKNTSDTYYKTDTHINLKGNLLIYQHFIQKIKKLFDIHIHEKEIQLSKMDCDSLSKLGKGNGDLTWPKNLEEQKLHDISDTFYFYEGIPEFYCSYVVKEDSKIRILKYDNHNLEDKTNENIDKVVEWNIVSNYIFYCKNNLEEKKRVLIFYDSFLLPALPLYFDMFYEIYFCKDIYNNDMIDCIQPDYIFEFRCERFLL